MNPMMITDGIGISSASLSTRDRRLVRSVARWTPLAGFAGGFTFAMPATLLVAPLAMYQAPFVLTWLFLVGAVGSVGWAHVWSGPERLTAGEWTRALGGVGPNTLLGAVAFALAIPLLGLPMATLLATMVQLSPLVALTMAPSAWLSRPLVQPTQVARLASVVTVRSAVTIGSQLTTAALLAWMLL
jgi:hypothetical protein